jgi:hypothetical protein
MTNLPHYFARLKLDEDSKAKLEAGTHEIDHIEVDKLVVREIDPVHMLDRVEAEFGITNWRGVILKMLDSGSLKPIDLKLALEEETESVL